jgi:hypothetical protein
MTKVTSPDPLNNEPTARFRAIMDGDKEEEPKRVSVPPRSILDGLPRAPKTEPHTSQPDVRIPKRWQAESPEGSGTRTPFGR